MTTRRRQRCVLPAGHGMRHLFVLTAATPILGDCVAVKVRAGKVAHVVDEDAQVIYQAHVGSKTWTQLERAMLRRPGLSRMEDGDRFCSIQRTDGGAAYNAPGTFKVETLTGIQFEVVITDCSDEWGCRLGMEI